MNEKYFGNMDWWTRDGKPRLTGFNVTFCLLLFVFLFGVCAVREEGKKCAVQRGSKSPRQKLQSRTGIKFKKLRCYPKIFACFFSSRIGKSWYLVSFSLDLSTLSPSVASDSFRTIDCGPPRLSCQIWQEYSSGCYASPLFWPKDWSTSVWHSLNHRAVGNEDLRALEEDA